MNLQGDNYRSDAPAKVTGTARYTGDVMLPGMLHAVMLCSTIARGRVRAIDTTAAEAMPGVAMILTHQNAPRLPEQGKAGEGRVLTLLQDDQVHYQEQPIGLVLADTLVHACQAADLVRVHYETTPATLSFDAARAHAYAPAKVQGKPADTVRGDIDAGMRRASARIQAVYTTPAEHHNPMEPHATVAAWEGEALTLYDSTQQVMGGRDTVAKTLGLAPDRVRLICPYIGGGFGSKGSVWSHVVLCAMAARLADKPVRLALTRRQMYGPVGNRPRIEQTLVLGAAADGALTALHHGVLAETSFLEDWDESSAIVTRMLYACDNQTTRHRLLQLNIGTPTFQRAPGESTGTLALEAAMDELACELNLDPLELRLRNYAERDPERRLPYSSKSLRHCYEAGAQRFGWSARDSRPGSMREGEWLVGMGMATATYPTHRMAASARVRWLADGSVGVQSGTQDLGTGTYTVLAEVAASTLGVARSRIKPELGDSDLPAAPISGGSMTVSSVGPAVRAAAQAVLEKIAQLAVADPASPAYGMPVESVLIGAGRILTGTGQEPVEALIVRHGGQAIEASAHVEAGDAVKRYAMHAFGAVYAKVLVHPELAMVRVAHLVGAYGVGKLINERTAHNQLAGGLVWGVGMALTEASLRDQRYGRYVNADLAEYHVPVNADIGRIDVIVVPEEDPHVNPLGAKGIGEIGITGVGGAIANAVYHATGKRVRDMPITPDKLLGIQACATGPAATTARTSAGPTETC